MELFARISRGIAKLIFRLLGRATIIDIPTDRFNGLVKELNQEGWKNVYEYNGFDAWIDYGNISLWKNFSKLKLEWDNWTEGSIEGNKKIIAKIAERDKNLKVVNYWRWSIYDKQS